MNKKIILGVCLSFILIFSSSLSLASYSTVQMEVVEKPVCTIDIGENSSFEKSLVNENLTEKEVTIQLQVTNEEVGTKPTGELMLVIDNSESMNEQVETGEIRSDLVYESAKTLVSKLLENNDNLQIGVVSFSSNLDASLEGSTEDASVVSPLTNNSDALSTAISSIQKNGPRTDLDAGLTLAMNQFTEEDNNKYMIVLTDGVPNIALGNNSYYSDEVINLTKTKLQEIGNQGINVITMLTGIDNASDPTPTNKDKTYGQVIEEILGTEEAPTVGDFYYVTDTEVEQTITQDIYNSLLPVSQSYTNIVIKDYFPQEIVDNFEFAYVSEANIGEVTAEINKEDNSITWTIPELKSGETATVQYKLKLKEDFDSNIVDKLLDTNEKVDITYKDLTGADQEKTSDVTPVLRLTEPPKELPKAGITTMLIGLAIATGLLIFSIIKLKTYKDIK